MRGLGDVITLIAVMLLSGIAVAAWLGLLAAVGIKVARWFL